MPQYNKYNNSTGIYFNTYYVIVFIIYIAPGLVLFSGSAVAEGTIYNARTGKSPLI